MNKLLACFLIFASLSAHAVVDMKNANYNNSWIDIIAPGSGYDLRITRSYNSRSLYSGLFGFGWNSDLETSLTPTPEGNIKLTEFGGGAEIIFAQQGYGKKEIQKSVQEIISKIKSTQPGKYDAKYLASLSEQLIEDTDMRAKYARQFGISSPIKPGATFYANGREVETIVHNKTYYTRTMGDGSSMRFSLQGQLIAIYDKNGNYLKFIYEKNQIRELVDNNGRKLSFKFYPNGKVKSITGPNNLSSEYKYKNLDDLSYVKNGWNNVYTYEYDDLHNLTKANYPDKTFIALTYDKNKDWVTSFRDRQKCIEKYSYETSKSDPQNHYWSTVTKTCGKETVAKNRFEFWYKNRFDGQSYLSRVLTNTNGNITDISYHEIFGRPISIRRNSQRMTFAYYPNGLVKSKATDKAQLDFKYDPKIKKISEVTTYLINTKGKRSKSKITQFRYDNRGNLTFAQNSDGQKITLTYDNRGRIASITDQAKKLVKISYEERLGKPSVVTRPGVGTIRVSYKANGDISKVDSKEGPTVAVQVASTFNNLLDIIAPATNEIYL